MANLAKETRMKKIFGLLMILASASFGVTEFAAADRGFSNTDVRGTYVASFDGFAYVPVPPAGSPTRVPVAAINRFVADGDGHITNGKRTLVVDGAAFPQTFSCSYQVNPDGTGSATCVIVPGNTTETFAFVLESRESGVFTGTTPGVTVLGTIERQQPRTRDDD
jgi:hypothetical protein